MCGIFGYVGKQNNAAKIVFEGLKAVEYRGYDSWGIAAKTKNSVFLQKEVGSLPKTNPTFPPSSIAFGHTRWATHGGITRENAHPHFDCQREIFAIHNGIIENFENLKRELKTKRHKFISETDTEVIAHLIEEELKDNKNKGEIEVVRKSFQKLEGLNAVIVGFLQKGVFILAKNLSPIAIGKKNASFYFASDPNAISLFTNNILTLEDGEIARIDKNGLNIFKLENSQKIQPKFFEYEPQRYNGRKKHLPHHMLAEILEEPLALSRLLKNKEQILHLAKEIKEAFGTYFIGAGSAGFAALFGTYILSKESQKHINFSFASEFSYLVDFLTKRSLVVAFSQSGETADVIFSVKRAKEVGAKIAAVVNVFGSTLYRLASSRVLLEAGPERCVLATKSFSSKLATIVLLAYALNSGYKEGERVIKKLITELRKMQNVRINNKIRTITRKFYKKEHLFVVGRGANYPLALEGALKIKEGSYLHAEGLAGGELKHGVIALIEKGTSCIVIAPPDETYADILSSAMEMKARGAYIIGVGAQNSSVFDEFIKIKNLGLGSYLLVTYVLQLLGYYAAVLQGINPDKPRNLAKSVTVK